MKYVLVINWESGFRIHQLDTLSNDIETEINYNADYEEFMTCNIHELKDIRDMIDTVIKGSEE